MPVDVKHRLDGYLLVLGFIFQKLQMKYVMGLSGLETIQNAFGSGHHYIYQRLLQKLSKNATLSHGRMQFAQSTEAW